MNAREGQPVNGTTVHPALPDRKTLAKTIDHALNAAAFCEPERTVIVQVVCDALLGRSNDKNG